MSQPVLLCGLGQVGWRVFAFLQAAGVPVVAIDSHCMPEDKRLNGARLVRGDFRQPEVLEQAGLHDARGVLILTSDDLANVSTAFMVRHLNPSVRVVVRVFNQTLLPRLGKTVRNVVPLSTSALTAPMLTLSALTGEAIGTFTLGKERRQVAELSVRDGAVISGLTLGTVAERYSAHVLAHLRVSGEDRFLLDVDADTALVVGDRLVICGEPRALAPLFEQVGDEALPHLLWAGWARRLGRMLWRTFSEIDVSVKICTITVLVVVLASSLTYHLGVGKSLPSGLFRTISVMTTGSDLHEEELQEHWQKVFVSLLRMFGAALMAVFTAIITNYLLRARLGGVFEARRIPDSGHVVVCGLGNVGVRVVEELLHYDEQVVVIEAVSDGRFAPTARHLGVPVIIGDATVLEVLHQAHAAQARAIVVATSNELVNLEVALLVRELNPKQRVVVRLADPYLAETLREGANVRLALSIPDLAAPAFVAALFGDRVHAVFMVKGRTLAVVELLVQPDDPFLHEQVVQVLALDYHLLPIALGDGEGREKIFQHRLAPGDHLKVLIELSNLERLVRRDRPPSDHAVEVSGFKLTARPLVVELLKTIGRAVPDGEDLARQLPFTARTSLTRGQAVVAAQELDREGLQVTVRKQG